MNQQPSPTPAAEQLDNDLRTVKGPFCIDDNGFRIRKGPHLDFLDVPGRYAIIDGVGYDLTEEETQSLREMFYATFPMHRPSQPQPLDNFSLEELEDDE